MTQIENDTQKSLVSGQITPRLYKKRWLMLFIYVFIFSINVMQCVQFTIIANVIVEYYEVSYEAVNWTFMITLLNIVIFFLPFCYLVDKYGVRVGALIGAAGTVLGAWTKVASVPSDKFWLVLLGQFFMSVPQIALFGMGPKLTANWFGENEVPIANAIGIIGIQLGVGTCSLAMPILVKQDTVHKDLFTTGLGLAIACTVGLVVVFVFFVDKPPIPPSPAELKKDSKVHYITTIKKLLKNVPFLLVLLQAGCNLAIFCAIQTLLNQMILKHYPGAEEDAGRMALLMMLFCTIGCLFNGPILSKFRTYRLCFCGNILAIAITLTIQTFTIKISIIYPYVTCSLFGFFFGLFWSSAYEIIVEVTYPEPEAITIGVYNALGQGSGIAFAYFYAFLFYDVSDTWANVFFAIASFASFAMAFCTKYDLKRTSANLRGSSDYIPVQIRPKVEVKK